MPFASALSGLGRHPDDSPVMRPGGLETPTRGLEVRRFVCENAGSTACLSQITHVAVMRVTHAGHFVVGAGAGKTLAPPVKWSQGGGALRSRTAMASGISY